MTGEKTIENKVCEYAISKGLLVYKMSSPARRGFPDRLFICKRGFSFYIEFKRTGGKLTALQNNTIKTMKIYRQLVYVIDNIKLGKKIIDDMLKLSEVETKEK